ncbi:hypothetical protein GH714_018490 [Hevea brasiliensis]|uniref:Uncharacterized protein n=1 Tax=Hevea brasiliensis TaxID=3981 RepID=A0A6A6MKR0_HEVBR|nr:hypothetical protein GH714_018490 [Hevea brasiliensis]
MSMAITKRLLANVILLLCLAMASFEAKGMRGAIIRPGPRAGRRRDPSEKIYNVVHFGFHSGMECRMQLERKGKATCPEGIFVASSMVFGGPCKNTAPTVFQLVGTLKAVSDLSSYAEDFWMIFQNVNGLVVTGTGTVDGQGPNVWKYNNHEGSVFPTSIKFYRVANGIIRRINSVNPMGFHIGIVLSQNIRARNLHLIAPEDSPNTDGIHISQSNQVKVARSVIATGDDCVGMIHGSTDISIKKVTCGPGHGISIGSLGKYPDEKDVKSILVRNCTLRNTENGIRIKTWAGSPPSQATALTFQDIIMHDVKNPIIDQSYGSKSKAPSKVQISDVKYMNISGTTASKVGVDIECSKQFPCQRVHLANINLKYTVARNPPPDLDPGLSTDSPAPAPVEFPESHLGPPEGVFDVTQYGAIADGKTESSKAFLATWDAACGYAGNSTFYIPQGEYFVASISFPGPCHNNQSPKVKIEGSLIAPSSLNALPDSNWIEFKKLNGIVLNGGNGVTNFDAQGAVEAWKQISCRN